MLWAPCLRIDLPADASASEARWLAAAAEPFFAAAEASKIGHLNVAVSGAAIEALTRHGCEALLDRIGALANRRRVELVATAAHGALLPLLSEDEIVRQLALNDLVNRRFFGEMYRPEALWTPQLAMSRKVAEMAQGRDITVLLVDEAALRQWPSEWPGERIPSLEGMPGMFLLPVSRAMTNAFSSSALRSMSDLRGLEEGFERAGGPERYVVTAIELDASMGPPRALAAMLQARATTRIQDLFPHFPLTQEISPLPCSRLSTADELGGGLPFAPWFLPDDRLHAIKWRLVTKLHDALRDLHGKGLDALPVVRDLRHTLDLAWRESWWRNPTEIGPVPAFEAHLAALEGVLPAERRGELLRLMEDLRTPQGSEMLAEASV